MSKQRKATVVVSLPPVPVTYRQRFEAWVASWYPGLKTKIIAAVGVIATTAAAVQEYITGLPLTEFVTQRTQAIIMAVLFTLAYWFKSLGDRYSAKINPPEKS